MCCYAHGSATIRFASTDESIINKVLECFEETVYGYKYEYSVCEESIFVSAWGYSEFSTSVISKMLDISVDNVWKRIERAKNDLKKALEEGENYE